MTSDRWVRRILRASIGALLLVACAAAAADDFAEGLAAYRSGDFVTAVARFTPLAEAGSPEAQFNLGLIYARGGEGVPAAPDQALRWYELAADQGFARAQYNLAKLYDEGTGVARDPFLAYFWFKLAGTVRYEDARKRRKKVAKELTPFEIAQADLRASEWARTRSEASPGHGSADDEDEHGR